MTALESLLGVWLPRDTPGWVALALALITIGVAGVRPRWLSIGRTRWWVAGCAVGAALLSAGYVHHYLRGGPRIIDATSYYLQAKALSQGLVAWPIDLPTASFRGRFLLLGPGHDSLAGIFPPGYPALLAVGVALGAPMAVGPVLAMTLVLLTAALTWQVTRDHDAVRVAAVLSTLCSALRYHTADTMSHGLAAVLTLVALVAAFRAGVQGATLAWWSAAGLALGWLAATRPATALAVAMLVLLLVAKGRSVRSVAAVFVGAALPLALLVVEQHAATGAWLQSSQEAYYAASDGPSGCFRYGFGRGMGCLVEHSTYVQAVLPDGYGWLAALGTTGRRLHLHLADIVNFAPLSALAVAGAWAGRRDTKVLLLAAFPLLLLAAYAPFYFDGSYPGGGARMYAEALPVEHVLVGVAAQAWALLFRRRELASAWITALAVALPLMGFAFHASATHLALRDRDGGRPLYEPAIVRAELGDSPRGLLFVSTDHAFNLAHDPSTRDAKAGLVVARERGDDRDRMAWQRLGRPGAWRYEFAPWSEESRPPKVTSWSPAAGEPATWRFEAEAEWPPLSQQGGYAVPTYLEPSSCVSAGRALAIIREAPIACVEVEVPVPGEGQWGLQVWLVADRAPELEARVETDRESVRIVQWNTGLGHLWEEGKETSEGRRCLVLPQVLFRAQRIARIRLCSKERWLGVDRLSLSPLPALEH